MRDDAVDDDTLGDEIDFDARDRALLAADRFDDLVDAGAIGVDASDSDRNAWDAALLSVTSPRRKPIRSGRVPSASAMALCDPSPLRSTRSDRPDRIERCRTEGRSRRPNHHRPSHLGRAWLVVGLLFAAFFGIRAIPSAPKPESTKRAALNAPAPQPRYVTRDIEDLQVGDTIIAADPETGEVAPRKIVQKFERIAYKLCVLELSTDDGLTQTLEPTPEHPFYLPATNEWREAGDLASGDQVLDPIGDLQTVVTNRIDDRPEGVRVYNMEVEGLHTYFVSAQGARAPPVLVHNTSGELCGLRAAPSANRHTLAVRHRLKPTKSTDIAALRREVQRHSDALNNIIRKEGMQGLKLRLRQFEQFGASIQSAGRRYTRGLGSAGQEMAWPHYPDMSLGGRPKSAVGGPVDRRLNSIIGGQTDRLRREILDLPDDVSELNFILSIR